MTHFHWDQVHTKRPRLEDAAYLNAPNMAFRASQERVSKGLCSSFRHIPAPSFFILSHTQLSLMLTHNLPTKKRFPYLQAHLLAVRAQPLISFETLIPHYHNLLFCYPPSFFARAHCEFLPRRTHILQIPPHCPPPSSLALIPYVLPYTASIPQYLSYLLSVFLNRLCF